MKCLRRIERTNFKLHTERIFEREVEKSNYFMWLQQLGRQFRSECSFWDPYSSEACMSVCLSVCMSVCNISFSSPSFPSPPRMFLKHIYHSWATLTKLFRLISSLNSVEYEIGFRLEEFSFQCSSSSIYCVNIK